MGEPAILPFDWADPFDLNHQLTDEERLVRDTAEGYAQEKLQPRVTSAYLDERFDREILSEMGTLGLLGATIPHEYGGAGLGYVSYGLIARAVEMLVHVRVGNARLELGLGVALGGVADHPLFVAKLVLEVERIRPVERKDGRLAH